MKKLKVDYKKTILTLDIFLVVLFALLYLSICFGNWIGLSAIIIISLFVILIITTNILVIKTFKMEYDSKAFYYTRMNKQDIYHFSDVIYIDEEYSIRHKSLTIINKEGKMKFINFDKNEEILDLFKTSCKNLKTREEVLKIFPDAKI